MNKSHRTFIHIGFSSILTVFLTLCMLIFAALSVATASSDLKLSREIAEKTTAYYRADTISRNFVQQIDLLLADTYHSVVSKEVYFDAAAERLPSIVLKTADESIHDYTVTASAHTIRISWRVPVTGIQQLSVTLQVCYPQHDTEHFFSITQWQTQTINDSQETALPID